jgi:hypothetical protein
MATLKDRWQHWDRKYEDVLTFANTHRHLNVPSTDPNTRRLATWLRQQEKRTCCVPDCPSIGQTQSREMKGIGTDGLQKYEMLVAFKKVDDHMVVTQKENNSLYCWITNQRQKAKQGKLSNERRNKLDEIDFPYSMVRVLCRIRDRQYTCQRQVGAGITLLSSLGTNI